MGKIKEMKSKISNFPIENTAFISKNKKRKEKRMAKKLSVKKIETNEFIPVKKPGLAPLNKLKKYENINDTKQAFKGNKKENSFLSAPLRKKVNEKLKKTIIVREKDSNSQKPKIKNNMKSRKVTFEEISNNETSKLQKPASAKTIKPYSKNEKKKVQAIDYEDDDTSSSEDASFMGQDFVNCDATEESDMSETSDDDSDNKNETDSDVDDNEGDDDADEDEDNTDEDDEDEDNTDEDIEDEIKGKTKNNSKQHSEIVIKKEKLTPVKKSEPKIVIKKEKLTPVKKSEQKFKFKKDAEIIINSIKDEVDNKLEEDNKEFQKPSDYVGFIRSISEKVTEDQIKSALAAKLSIKDILLVRNIPDKKYKDKKHCFVYIQNEDSLEKLVKHKFKIEDVTFFVHKARESKKEESNRPVAFLPRVPFQVKDEILKKIIEQDIGTGNILEMKTKNVSQKYRTRNVLLFLPNEDILKKMIFKGEYKIDEVAVIVREAFESSCKIPMYRVVYNNVPDDTTETFLKKEIEDKLGKGTVSSIRFSFRKRPFAFVTLQNEEALKKALSVDNAVTVEGNNLKTVLFKPRKPDRKQYKLKRKIEEGQSETVVKKSKKSSDKNESGIEVKQKKKKQLMSPQNSTDIAKKLKNKKNKTKVDLQKNVEHFENKKLKSILKVKKNKKISSKKNIS